MRERRDKKLFSILVLTGTALAATLPACSSPEPDPKTDGGTNNGQDAAKADGAKFW